MNSGWRTITVAMLAVFAIAWLVACGEVAGNPPPEPAEPKLSESRSVRLMSFNIEWGGTHVRFESIAEAIRASGADIVGIQEAEGNLTRLAGDLGWQYDLRNYVVSKFPLIDPPDAGGRYVLVEVLPGKVLAVGNVHLSSYPSGAAWLQAGRTPAQVVAMERRVRLPEIQPVLGVLPGLAQRGTPVYLIGDFNAPSHEDWIEATVGKFAHRNYPIDWPVTRAVADVGLRDSFRDTHKDPVTQPGFTWWADRPKIPEYNPTDASRQSRIDYLWYGGPAKVTGSWLVGETGASGVAVSVTPWPSDHRAVVSDFDVVPAPMPLLVAAERRVHHAGNPLRFVYNNSSSGGSIAIEWHGDRVVTERRIAVRAERGRLELPDAFLRPGYYQVALHDESAGETARNDFWILAPDAKPSVEVRGQSFARGEPLPVSWRNGPGNRNDWVGIFDTAAADERSYLAWAHVGAASSGEMLLSRTTAEDGWPLSPGRYVARLLLDDGFGLLAESGTFTVE